MTVKKKEKSGHKITFFGGKYVQGGFISEQVEQYELYTNSEDIKKKLQKFIEKNHGIWDLKDTCEFIMEYRSELLKILK